MDIQLQTLNEELPPLNPPSPRDREIFEQAVVLRRSQREIAQERRISQPRVNKIVAEVGAWLCRVLPASLAGEEPQGKLAVATWVAKSRLEHLLARTVQSFEESRRDKVTHKHGLRKDVPWQETITTTQTANAGLINSALRAALASARLSGVDVTGKSIREAAMAAQAKEAPSAVIAQSQKQAEIQEILSPQVARQQPLATEVALPDMAPEILCKRVIKDAQHHPEGSAKESAKGQGLRWSLPLDSTAVSFAGASGWCPRTGQKNGVESTVGLSRSARRRHEREQRRISQHRRRDFLAPLAAG